MRNDLTGSLQLLNHLNKLNDSVPQIRLNTVGMCLQIADYPLEKGMQLGRVEVTINAAVIGDNTVSQELLCPTALEADPILLPSIT